MKLFNCLALSLLFLLQFAIARYSHCSQMTSLVSLLNAAAMLLMFLLYLPLYGCQTRNVALRRLLAIGTPLGLSVYGITMSNHNSRFICASNHALSMLVRSESVLISVVGVVKLLVAIYIRTEFHLYSKDFDEAYEAMEERVKQVMERQIGRAHV